MYRTALAAMLLWAPLVAHSAFVDVNPLAPPVSLGAGTTAAADPSLAGVVIADDVNNFSGTSFNGQYQTRVVRRDDTGTLDFYYRIVSFTDQAQDRVLRDFRIGDFADWQTSATWRPDGVGTENPLIAVKFPQAPQCVACDGINLSFADFAAGVPSNFNSGDDSRFMVIRTSATAFTTTSADVYLVTVPGVPFDQFLSAGFSVYAPVPEPSSLTLFALGLLMLAWRFSRRAGTAIA